MWLLIVAGGYYVIEQARLQLHLVALNTNFYSEQNMLTTDPEDMDPAGQWAWLEEILLKARRRRGTVRTISPINFQSAAIQLQVLWCIRLLILLSYIFLLIIW